MSSSPTSSATYDSALRAYRAGDRVGARLQLEAVLARDPSKAAVRLLLARLALEGNDPAAARMHLRQVIVLQPSSADAWLQLANLDARAGDPATTVATLRAARAAIPGHVGILTNLGVMLGETGAAAEGRAALEEALRLDARSAITHFNLGRLLKDMGAADEALRHYDQAIALKPDFTQAHHNRGNLLLDLDRAGEAMAAFRVAAQLRLGLEAPVEREPRFRKTNAAKLRHDIEQLRYLRARDLVDARYDRTIADYEGALAALPPLQPGETMVDIPKEWLPRLVPAYNRLIHWDAGAAVPGPALNPALDFAAIEARYHGRAPGIAWFDGLLTQEALRALRRFCLESTIWSEFRYSNGYLGGMLDRGFACPLLHQIASELAASMPGIFAGHPLAKTWAFKYDSRLAGIPIHADFAAVNVNFWITPDEANLDPEGGGLGVWDKEAPLDWDFASYNKNEAAIRAFLQESGAQMLNVPHRQNRAVMFNSDLFHETGTLTFKEGYENRRINVTMLFGRRASA